MRHVLIVMSDPVEGREDEYNDWYDNIHLGEVLQVPGFVAAQRFIAAAPMPGRDGPPLRYLSIYEIEADDAGAPIAALVAAAKGMDISSAINATTTVAYAFTEHGPRMVAS